MIRGYMLGYGVGIPDVYRQLISPHQRYYAVKSLRETILLFLFESKQITESLYLYRRPVSNFSLRPDFYLNGENLLLD